MSRPSRGFSVAQTRPGNSGTCPAITSFDVDTSNVEDWDVSVVWAPAVNVTSLTVEYQVNGGVFSNAATLVNQATPFNYDFHWSDFVAEGDFVGIRVRLTGPGACGAILTAIITNQAEP